MSGSGSAPRMAPLAPGTARPDRAPRTIGRALRAWLINGSTLPLFRSPWFWAAAVVKLVLGSVLASYYMRDLFVPFVNYFAESRLANP